MVRFKSDRLEELPGVGHKTASVLYHKVLEYQPFPDTHIHRLAQRWGLTNGKSVIQPKKTERIFQKNLEQTHLQIIFMAENFVLLRL